MNAKYIITIAAFVFIICLITQTNIITNQFNLIKNKLDCRNTCSKKNMKALNNKNITNSCLCVPPGFVSPEIIQKKTKNMIIL